MQQTAAQLHRELSKASCPSRPSVCGEPPRQAGPSRTGELPRRARTSSASSSSTASWTFATADEPPPEAHANLRPTSLWTPTANKNLLGKLKLRGELDLRGKPRPPPAAHPSGRAANLHGKSRPSPAAHPSGRAATSRDLRGKDREAAISQSTEDTRHIVSGESNGSHYLRHHKAAMLRP